MSCYRILNSLYVLGTTSSIYMEGYSLILELHLLLKPLQVKNIWRTSAVREATTKALQHLKCSFKCILCRTGVGEGNALFTDVAGRCCLANGGNQAINPQLSHVIMFPCRQRAAAGACLAALTGTFPVCFLEPALNQNNPRSIYNTSSVLDREGIHFSLCGPLRGFKGFRALSDSSLSSFRAGTPRSCGGHVSSLAFSGAGSRTREAAGRRWCWGSPGPVHPCHRGHFAHAVQLHVSLVVLGTGGTAR